MTHCKLGTKFSIDFPIKNLGEKSLQTLVMEFQSSDAQDVLTSIEKSLNSDLMIWSKKKFRKDASIIHAHFLK